MHGPKFHLSTARVGCGVPKYCTSRPTPLGMAPTKDKNKRLGGASRAWEEITSMDGQCSCALALYSLSNLLDTHSQEEGRKRLNGYQRSTFVLFCLDTTFGSTQRLLFLGYLGCSSEMFSGSCVNNKAIIFFLIKNNCGATAVIQWGGHLP